ncbi:MAG TPA: DinB family protein [Thermoanaerobaculia bacterium]|jgi:hypothetical protein|nr:DinB family protein [Thermoanaerobaculia bacterium]
MHPRTEELLHYLDTQRAVLRAAVDSVPAERREVPPEPGRWSVAGVLEHLSQVETSLTRLFNSRLSEAKARGLGPETETTPILGALGMERVVDRSQRFSTSQAAQPQAGLDAEKAWAALEAAGAAFREALLAGDGLALGELVHPHVLLGPFNFYQWAAFVGAHEARHAAQIREIGAALEGD